MINRNIHPLICLFVNIFLNKEMEISYSRKLKKKIEEDIDCLKNYGKSIGTAIIRRKRELTAAPCLGDMKNMPGRHHELKEDRKCQISCSLTENYRLIYEPDGDIELIFNNNSLVWGNVYAVKLVEVSNHYER